MSDLYEASFRWPHTDALTVIVTGSFDDWSCSTRLSKTPTGFEGTVKIPWGQKVTYKYVVDGRWTTTDDQPTELDPIGNLNNVYTSPARPSPTTQPSPPAVLAPVAVTPATGSSTSAIAAAAPAPGATSQGAKTPAESAPSPAPESAPAPEPTPAEPEAAAEVSPAAVVPTADVAPVTPTEPPTNGALLAESPVSAPKPLETTVVESTAAAAPVAEASTHAPTNGVKPATNGTTSTNGAKKGSPPTTPQKEKRMRFPSISSRSRSSVASASEMGELSPDKKDGVAERFGSSQRKKRSSLFGKLKDVFHHA
ncbi:hypothetical protein A0H81_08264 [Grifola frondosa]|uniref:AMP-activated protein kinase glycogen-binding domain-containing protein n=1 Tax=Grifola frondosa TaxID=5627 RepID=A0A1C7M4S4_GRIFR|nr:hypothetical protein A0H81_08264 [Grifola frondosa]